MNKTDVIAGLQEKTGFSQEICTTVMDALEDISGNVLVNRFKGTKLDNDTAVAEISQKSGVPAQDCKTILTAFEEVFSEALAHKFRFFKRK